MNGMNRTCWIVTPTLDRMVGERTVKQAAATAGISTRTFVAVDHNHDGGVATANIALAEAQGTPYICYINDDVEFPQPGWLRELIEALEKNPRNGVVGPSGGCGIAPQSRSKQGMPYGIRPVVYLSFFCVVFRRDTFDELGLLDSRFKHYGCDNDYCLQAIQAGWRVVYAQHVWVKHQSSPTIRKWKNHDVLAFREKWGGSTGEVAQRFLKEYPKCFSQ